MMSREEFDKLIQLLIMGEYSENGFGIKEKQFISQFFTYENLIESSQNLYFKIEQDAIEEFIYPMKLTHFFDEFSRKRIRIVAKINGAWLPVVMSITKDEDNHFNIVLNSSLRFIL